MSNKQYDNTNRGRLFVNYRKTKDSDPDFTGDINVNGVEFWLNGWIKTSRNGVQFTSLSVKPKQQRQEQREQHRPSANANFDESPF